MHCSFDPPKKKNILALNFSQLWSSKPLIRIGFGSGSGLDLISIRIGSGSGSVFSLKCWIRIRIKFIRIRNTGINYLCCMFRSERKKRELDRQIRMAERIASNKSPLYFLLGLSVRSKSWTVRSGWRRETPPTNLRCIFY